MLKTSLQTYLFKSVNTLELKLWPCSVIGKLYIQEYYTYKYYYYYYILILVSRTPNLFQEKTKFYSGLIRAYALSLE